MTPPRAKIFVQAYTHNQDDVYRRCIFYKTSGDVFAADLYAHKVCMNLYMLRFSRELYDTLESLKEIEQEEAGDEATQIAFDYVFNQLKLETQGYAVTAVKNLVNKHLRGKDIEINNQQVKGELIRRNQTITFVSHIHQTNL